MCIFIVQQVAIQNQDVSGSAVLLLHRHNKAGMMYLS